ncbi:hypothetical protein OG417_06270 [Actinoallomurus sp. NBC_01490]|nr:hypothetical protein [Actinoallomurus sp. NBC_01490]
MAEITLPRRTHDGPLVTKHLIFSNSTVHLLTADLHTGDPY